MWRERERERERERLSLNDQVSMVRNMRNYNHKQCACQANLPIARAQLAAARGTA